MSKRYLTLVFLFWLLYHIYMKYQVERDKIVIEKNKDFDAESILTCGQMFRYFKTEKGFEVITGKNLAEIYEKGDKVIIKTTSPKRFVEFFDLDTDYSVFKRKLSKEPFMKDAISFGEGIRIAKGEPEEIIFQFIISQNNNIKRIQKIVEKMSEIGEKINDKYNAFPTAKTLSKMPKEYFESLGAGYRAEYLYNASQILAKADMSEIAKLPTKELESWLLKIKGIGPKVASCILLFGFNRTECFPVDTWMEKVYRKYFYAGEMTRPQISAFMQDKFETMSGIAQQYLFNYFQKNKITL